MCSSWHCPGHDAGDVGLLYCTMQEELPIKLQEVSKEDYAQMMCLMEANKGHADDPKVGLFWYEETTEELLGVVSQPVLDFKRAFTSGGPFTCSETHGAVWMKLQMRQINHGNIDGPFIGPYENKPRGRVFYLMDEDRYVVAVGHWLEEYPEAKELILDEFDLPADKTTFEYAIHWDIGHSWR